MMIKDRTKLVGMFLLCVIPFSAYGSKYGVLHLKPVAVSQATSDVVANLLAGALIDLGHTVMDPDAMDRVAGEVLRCYEVDCALDIGSAARADRVIFGSVSALGEKHIVQVSVADVATRETIWAGSLAAKTAEDLDTVVKRLAMSISGGKTTEKTAEVGSVTQEEEKEPLRRRVFHTAGISVGMAIPLGGYADAGSMVRYGTTYWFEMPHWAVEVAAYYAHTSNLGFNLEGSAGEVVGPEISVLYLLNKGNISPYFGGGIGLGMIMMQPEGDWDIGTGIGPAFNVGGGLVFFRTYDIRITLDARYRINLAHATGFDGEDPRFEGPHHGFSFSIGFSYRPRPRGCGIGGFNIW
jgi:hypothetical protein